MACVQYLPYIGAGTRTHLDTRIDESIRDTREILGIDPEFGVPDTSLSRARMGAISSGALPVVIRQFRQSGPLSVIPFEGNQRAWSIDNNSWNLQENRAFFKNSSYRGLYNYSTGSIFLHHPYWCRHTIIHEVLHATSIFSRLFSRYNVSQWSLHIPFIEGITECLTGFILNRKYPGCYEYWVNHRLAQCAIDTPARVKLWSSLCQHTEIQNLANFYLSRSVDFRSTWNQFQEHIRVDHHGFLYDLDIDIPFNERNFREMCVHQVTGFRDTYWSRNSLDFSRII